MNCALEELVTKTRKSELTDDAASQSLTNIFDLKLYDYRLPLVFNISTLGELLDIDYSKLVDAYDYGHFNNLDYIKRKVHSLGFLLKGEYEDLNISDKVALISVNDLNIDPRLKRTLRNAGLGYLCELLSVPLDEIVSKNSKNYASLRECLQSLGFELKSDSIEVEKKKEQLRADGEFMIDTMFPAATKLQNTLAKQDIYTLSQLLDRDIGLIPEVGAAYQGQIVDRLGRLSLDELYRALIDAEIDKRDRELYEHQCRRNELLMRKAALRVELAIVDSELAQLPALGRNRAGGLYVKK